MATDEDYTPGSDDERRRRQPQQKRRPQSSDGTRAASQGTRRARPANGQASERTGERRRSHSAQGRPAQGTRRAASASGERRPASGEARRQNRRPAQESARGERTGERRRPRPEGSQQRRQGSATPRQAGTGRPRQQNAPRRNPNHSASRSKAPGNLPLVPLIVGAVAVIALGIGIYLFFNPLSFTVTINGTEQTVKRGTTITKVIEDGLVSPKPGDLLAVDESTIEKGGGDVFSATVNGQPTNDGSTVIERGAEVVISDGANVTEDYDQTEEVIKFGQGTVDTDMGSYFNYALHVYSDGEDGLETTKTGKVSGKTVVEQTKPVVDAGYYIYTPDTGDDKVIALTFDDGPWPETTEQILDVLEKYDAKATFFTIGNQISNNTAALKRAHEMGCQICTHTWDHAEGSGQGVNMTYMSKDEQIEEVTKGLEAIEKALGTKVEPILRAPGGNFYGDTIEYMRPYITAEIGWDVDTEDWSRPGVDAIYQAIMTVKPGQVILMHDGGGDRSETVEALAKALPELQAAGYSFVTVNDLLAYGLPSSKPSSIPTTTDSSKSSSYGSSSSGSSSSKSTYSSSDSDSDSSNDSDSDYDSDSDSSSSSSKKTSTKA